MTQWTFRARLYAVGATVTLALFAVALLAIYNGNQVATVVKAGMQRQNDFLTLVEFRQHVLTLHGGAMDVMADAIGKRGGGDVHRANMASALRGIADKQPALVATGESDVEIAIIRSIEADIAKLLPLVQELVTAVDQKAPLTQLGAIADRLDAQTTSVVPALNQLGMAYQQELIEGASASLATLERGRHLVFGAVILAVLTLAAMLYQLMQLLRVNKRAEDERQRRSQFIEAGALHLRQTMDRVAAGDLRERAQISGEADDVMVGMAHNLNRMIESLAAMAGQIGQASVSMESTLAQVRAALTSQAAGAAQQASATAQTSATLEEIRVTAAQTLEKADFLGQVSERARVQSERGSQAVDHAVSGMDLVRQRVEAVAHAILELSKKNHQIGAITDAVEDLASQSRMLALNASIEAAKAGEAGLGFAVVAEEIRNLAEQSRAATTQVKAILQAIQDTSDHVVMAAEEGTKQVAVGTSLAVEAGEVIGNLGVVVRQAAASSQQIAAVVRQETAGIEQIAQAMSEIARSVTQGVTAVRQTEQAMSDLTHISQQLKQRVGQYRI